MDFVVASILQVSPKSALLQFSAPGLKLGPNVEHSRKEFVLRFEVHLGQHSTDEYS